MGKLMLSVEELRVDSFDTVPSLQARGTVRGAGEDTNESGCIIQSCGVTCPISCDPSCPRGGCDTLEGCNETNESGCIIQSCGVTCHITCGPSCPPGGCDT